MARSVLITGGTGALGEAVTQRFLDQGDRVSAGWVVEEQAIALREHVGDAAGALTLVRGDVTDPDSVGAMVDEVSEKQGDVDVLVHLVGAYKGGERVEEQSDETWDRMLQLNLTSAFICCREVLPAMYRKDWGRVVIVSSRNAKVGRAGQSAYSIAKAAVAVLAESIAEEARGTGVTANVIAPSTLDTPGNRAAMPNADHSKWVPTSDVAASIAWLASDEAGVLRGAWLPVYGSV
jgi:NAD(P)-dependent dehydrogenase (short-subunit alcohol dehydrogenase family)